MIWRRAIFMAVVCLLVSSPGHARQNWQTQKEMEVAATHFLNQHFGDEYELKYKFGRLDTRLKLAKCQKALHVFLPVNREPVGSVSMGIRCPQPEWKIHLPVRVSAFTQVLVARHPIPRNTIIKQEDLQSIREDIGRYYAGVFTKTEDLVGMVASRSIRDNAVITPRMVKPKRLIKRGDMITIIAESNGLQIRTKGEALMDGHRGQVIQVKNHRSGRQISAEVIAQSTVRVKL
ncbi:MAG: flagellar basal body P-ring formation chaperone FlgA [Thioalkalispiraceae bacterium]